jgi:KUP system potassium uptake protein
VYLQLDSSLLDAARAACVALPAAGLPPALRRFRSRGWALVAPLSIVAVVAALAVWPAGAQGLAWAALVLVPPGAALALGWAAHGSRPWPALLTAPLLAVALIAPDGPAGELARVAMMAGSCVTAGRLLVGVVPLPLLKVGVVAMAAIDATVLLGHLSDHENARFAAAVAGHGLPQLQVATLGGASCDFGDFFAAGLVGAILARDRHPQLVAAAATFLLTQVFDQLFLVVDSLPATVPPAVVMLLLDARRHPILRRRRARGDSTTVAKLRNGGAALGALGVVFGDIGTSPIYTVQTAFDPGDPHPVAVSLEAVYGIVSLLFWAVTLIVTVKYVLLVMSADDDGEGGTMALISQVRKLGRSVSRRRKLLLAALGVFGAGLFFGDSMITPAISVLSAVEGVKTIEPSLDAFVVPITVTIIVLLFILQRLGTGAIGRLFGPIMLLWFVSIAVLGIRGIAMHPAVLEALSPTYAFDFLFHDEPTGFFALTAVVLAFTGVEALFADMGHFGRTVITRAWLLLVFPACILSYLGQGALIADDPTAIGAPFFRLSPHAGLIPLVVLATAATVIASQAVISGAFTLAHQAAHLGYLPRLRVIHTSAHRYGRVYVPVVNSLLLVAVLALVLAFQSSAKLAFAYGTAVTGTLITTTILYFFIVRHRWHRPLWLVLVAATGFLAVELAFLASNLTKIGHGAWLPLVVGVIVFTVMVTWFRGQELVAARRSRLEGALDVFVEQLPAHEPPVARVPGTGIFLSRRDGTVPLSMRACTDRLHALPQHAIILSIENVATPRVRPADRLQIDDLGYEDDGITFVRASYGYAEHCNVPALVRKIAKTRLEARLDVHDVSYYVSKVELTAGGRPALSRWRKQLFLATGLLAASPEQAYRLPRKRTVTLGSEIEI